MQVHEELDRGVGFFDMIMEESATDAGKAALTRHPP
jgi:hypothetical protein